MKNKMKMFTAVIAGLLLAVSSTAAKAEDIVGIASGNKDFSTLVTAVKAAGLVETLQGAGPFTVFAPTNAAFAKLPKATLAALLKDKKALTAILTYHVVSGKVMAADVVKLKDGTKVKTVNGAEIKVSNKHGVKVNDSNVVKTDIEASNGVIHVIDTVLIPKTKLPSLWTIVMVMPPPVIIGGGFIVARTFSKAGNKCGTLDRVTGWIPPYQKNRPPFLESGFCYL